MGASAPVGYSIEAIRYGVARDIPVGALIVGRSKDENFQKFPTAGRVECRHLLHALVLWPLCLGVQVRI